MKIERQRIGKMRRKDMQTLMGQILDQISKTRDAGQKEYARDLDNVFANFERVASFVGVSRE